MGTEVRLVLEDEAIDGISSRVSAVEGFGGGASTYDIFAYVAATSSRSCRVIW